jgi:hypothetical protein
VGVEPAETSEDGLRHGHLRDALLLPVLPLQIEDRGELSQAPALGAQHQVDVALERHPPVYLADRRLRFFRNRDVSARDSFEAPLAIDIDEEADLRRFFRRKKSLATIPLR